MSSYIASKSSCLEIFIKNTEKLQENVNLCSRKMEEMYKCIFFLSQLYLEPSDYWNLLRGSFHPAHPLSFSTNIWSSCRKPDLTPWAGKGQRPRSGCSTVIFVTVEWRGCLWHTAKVCSFSPFTSFSASVSSVLFFSLFMLSQSSSQSASGCEGPCCSLISHDITSDILFFTLSSLTTESQQVLWMYMRGRSSHNRLSCRLKFYPPKLQLLKGHTVRGCLSGKKLVDIVTGSLSMKPYLLWSYLPAKKFRLKR